MSSPRASRGAADDALPGAGGDGAVQRRRLDESLIEELEIGVRSYNCLKRAGIQTVGELVRKSESELNAIPNFGEVDRRGHRDPARPRPRPARRLSDGESGSGDDQMRHGKKRNKLSRDSAHRKSLLTNLPSS